MGKRRRKDTRKRRTPSADLRFNFVLLLVAVMILVLGSALVSQLQAAEWTSAITSGAIILVLVTASFYSALQRRGR